MISRNAITLWLVFTALHGFGQESCSFKLGKLKYEGGGDWYANPSSLPNMIKYINENAGSSICNEPTIVSPNNSDLTTFPVIYATGHGNIYFTEQEVLNLRNYIEAGGFLFFDDNYGMHKYIMRELAKIFPESVPKEIPFTHPIFHKVYSLKGGMPKIHQHDGLPAKLLGLTFNGRLAVVVTHESDLGDGWEDATVHNDPENVRQAAFQMGVNIISYAISQTNN